LERWNSEVLLQLIATRGKALPAVRTARLDESSVVAAPGTDSAAPARPHLDATRAVESASAALPLAGCAGAPCLMRNLATGTRLRDDSSKQRAP
jgi:hypothetical protein